VEAPSKDIGVTLSRRQLSRNQPFNAHALFGGFEMKRFDKVY
jgi:hypothetical protein